jgi:S1-C subfamily serine protease
MHAFLAPLLVLFLLGPGGWLGVYLAADRAEAVVTEVVPGSPAQQAGLQAGDIVLAVDDAAVPGREALIARIRQAAPGDRVQLRVRRAGEEILLAVRLGERPSESAVAETVPPAPSAKAGRPGVPGGEAAAVRVAAAARPPYLGVAVAEADGGIAVERVLAGSPAAAVGLAAGDRLLVVGGHEVASLAALDAALADVKAGRPLPILVQRGQQRQEFTVVPTVRGKVAAKSPDAVPGHGAPAAVVRPHGARDAELAGELDALRQELEQLRRELRELRAELGRERK